MKIRILNDSMNSDDSVHEIRDPEGELIREAIENIIPPSMGVISKWVKEGLNRGSQDVFAKYVAHFGPSYAGRGKLFNTNYIAGLFERGGTIASQKMTHVLHNQWIEEFPEEAGEETDKISSARIAGREAHRVFPYGELPSTTHGNFQNRRPAQPRVWLSTGPKYEAWAKEVTDNFARMTENWANSYVAQDNESSSGTAGWERKYLLALTGDADGDGTATDGDSQKALLVMAQQYKSYTKQVKKFFKKNPSLADLEGEFFADVVMRWEYGQDKWINQIKRKFKLIREYLSEGGDNFQKIDAIFKKHPKRVGDPPTSISALHAAKQFIKDHKDSRNYERCDAGWENVLSMDRGEDTDGDNPCVLDLYDNGKFWFNRDAAFCNIGATKLANCGEANIKDSVLLMLKQRVAKPDKILGGDKVNPVNETIKYLLMLEYNPRLTKIIQILGHSNSFPPEEHWKEIKDAWEKLERPELDGKAWRYLLQQDRTDLETINKFEDYIFDGEAKLSAPEEWLGRGGMAERLSISNPYYTDQLIGGNRRHRGRAAGLENIMISFLASKAGQQLDPPLEVRLKCYSKPFEQDPEIWNKETDKKIKAMVQEHLTKVSKDVQNLIRILSPSQLNPAEDVAIKIWKAHTIYKSSKRMIVVGALLSIPSSWFTDQEPDPNIAHDIIMEFRERLGPVNTSIFLDSIIRTQQNEADNSEFVAGHFGNDGEFTPDEHDWESFDTDSLFEGAITNLGLSEAREITSKILGEVPHETGKKFGDVRISINDEEKGDIRGGAVSAAVRVNRLNQSMGPKDVLKQLVTPSAAREMHVEQNSRDRKSKVDKSLKEADKMEIRIAERKQNLKEVSAQDQEYKRGKRKHIGDYLCADFENGTREVETLGDLSDYIKCLRSSKNVKQGFGAIKGAAVDAPVELLSSLYSILGGRGKDWSKRLKQVKDPMSKIGVDSQAAAIIDDKIEWAFYRWLEQEVEKKNSDLYAMRLDDPQFNINNILDRFLKTQFDGRTVKGLKRS